MVIPRRHLRVLLCCAGFVAFLLLSGVVLSGTAGARPLNYSDLGPTNGGSGDPTGDDQPSPTPKLSKAVSVQPRAGSQSGEPTFRSLGRISTLWFAYRRLLPFGPRF
jgi:hypothetical protein